VMYCADYCVSEVPGGPKLYLVGATPVGSTY
jgi:hypothetical protein